MVKKGILFRGKEEGKSLERRNTRATNIREKGDITKGQTRREEKALRKTDARVTSSEGNV